MDFKEYENVIVDKIKDYVSEQKLLREEAQKLSFVELNDYTQRSFNLLSQSHLSETDREILTKVNEFVEKVKDRRLQEQIYIYGQLITRGFTTVKPEEKSAFALKLFEKAIDDYKSHKKEKDGLVQMAERQEQNFLLTAIISVIIVGGFIILITMFMFGFFR